MHRYGGPEVLQLEEVDTPRCGPNDVRISVHATSVNPVDFKIREGMQRAVVWISFPFIPGMDVSGVISEVGVKVTAWKVGDEVFASPSHLRQGTYAEEVVVRASEVAHKPKNLSHVEAASLPLVAMTAWYSLVKSAKLKSGQRVLIQAGAGGVGTAAIQLAKALGASEVFATCSTRNVELVRSLGATPIDYTKDDYRVVARGVDVVLDSLGGEHLVAALKLVKRFGHVSCITPSFPTFAKKYGIAGGFFVFLLHAAWLTVSSLVRKQVTLAFVTRFAVGTVLHQLGQLAEQGKLKPVVDRTYPLSEVAEAHRYAETGRARGKIVLTVR